MTTDPVAPGLKKKIILAAQHAKQVKERYDELVEFPFPKECTHFLPIRHFNSDTPAKPGNRKNIPYSIACRPLDIQQGGIVTEEPALIGGGYFLWHKGHGIAIDPGFGFVYALYFYHGITIRDINTVIITHDHMDHNADLETIILLKQKKEENIKIYAPVQVLEAYHLQDRACMEGSIIKVQPLAHGEVCEDPSSDISITPLPAMHWQRCLSINNRAIRPRQKIESLLEHHFSAVGVMIEMKSTIRRILITGDTLFPLKQNGDNWFAYAEDDKHRIPYMNPRKATFLGWTPRNIMAESNTVAKAIIERQCEKMAFAYSQLKRCDIVCLHIGSIKGIGKLRENDEQPVDWESVINNPDYCYPGFHLGFTGCMRVLNLLIKDEIFKPENGLVVMTEFGEELLGHRRTLADALSNAMKCIDDKNDVTVLPSDVTLNIRLAGRPSPLGGAVSPSGEGVLCNYRRELISWKDVVALEGPGEIITYTIRDETGKAHPQCTHP